MGKHRVEAYLAPMAAGGHGGERVVPPSIDSAAHPPLMDAPGASVLEKQAARPSGGGSVSMSLSDPLRLGKPEPSGANGNRVRRLIAFVISVRYAILYVITRFLRVSTRCRIRPAAALVGSAFLPTALTFKRGQRFGEGGKKSGAHLPLCRVTHPP
jgi:hypothetical protein